MYVQQPDSLIRLKEALIRGLIWTFIGFLYGALFVFLAQAARFWHLPMIPAVFAAVVSATLAALIYSSMRLAVLMAMLVSPLSIGFIIASGNPADPVLLLLMALVSGALVGALYGYFSTRSRVHRADAKTLTGFSAGWLAALVYLLLSPWLESHPIALQVGYLCPLTGFIYVWLLPTFVKLYDNLLPPLADGLLVGLGISAFVSMSFFVMISSVDPEVAGPAISWIEGIYADLPQAMLSGSVGGGLAGVISGLFLTKWQDL